jgi:threonine dehydratase
LELLQHSGSFKARGAFANLHLRDVPEVGVVAASGGNHGAAVAYAARKRGVPATIFVPNITSPAKAKRIRDYGATLIVGGERYADALAASEKYVHETGALPVHAFDQIETLLGQGTLGRELEQQMPEVDTLLVAVGGGGLIGGVAAWYEGRIKIVAVESDGAPTLHAAFAAGHPIDAPAGGIAADSLAPRRVGERAFRLARAFVSAEVVLVSDDEIRRAQEALWSTLRIVERRLSRRLSGSATVLSRTSAWRCWCVGGIRLRFDLTDPIPSERSEKRVLAGYSLTASWRPVLGSATVRSIGHGDTPAENLANTA